jgi:hypothetical protein
MQSISKDGNFDDIVAAASPEVQAIAQRLRDLIANMHPEVVEVVWAGQGIAGYGVGPKKMSEQYSYIAPQTNYVNLGFYQGASLPDPKGLLEGSGQALRHVKVRTPADVERSDLRRLLEAALAERQAALAGEA